MIISFLCFFTLVGQGLAALRNVTLDDLDSRIMYEGLGWGVKHRHDWDSNYFRGSHAYSNDPNARIAFNFTGVAIYYYSSRWSFDVRTVLSLDDEPRVEINLQDFHAPPGKISESSIVWSRTGLPNGPHSLVVSAGNFALMDGLIYTEDIAEVGPSVPGYTDVMSVESMPATTLITSTATLASTVPDVSPSSSEQSGPQTSNSVAIIGSTVGAAVTALVAINGFLFCWIRRRRRHRYLRQLENSSPVPYVYRSSRFHPG